MIMFVDDDINRHLAFAARNPGRNIFQTASTFNAFIELSQSYMQLEELWLDHDLGYALNPIQREFHPSGNDINVVDTMPLVRWLCAPDCPVLKSTKITVHSWNMPAAERMMCDLIAAGYRDVTREPFKA